MLQKSSVSGPGFVGHPRFQSICGKLKSPVRTRFERRHTLLGLIERTCTGLDDAKTLSIIFLMWAPHTKKNIPVDKVEKVRRRATKFILKTEDNNETHLKKLHFMSLKNRRFLADVTFLYKALNGISNINII